MNTLAPPLSRGLSVRRPSLLDNDNAIISNIKERRRLLNIKLKNVNELKKKIRTILAISKHFLINL